MTFEDFKEAVRQHHAEQERKKLRAEQKQRRAAGLVVPATAAQHQRLDPAPVPLAEPGNHEDYTGSVCLLHSLTEKFPSFLEVLVDAEDLVRLSSHRWKIVRSGKNRQLRVTNTRNEYLHTVVTNAPKGTVVDHIFHRTLDNRKGQLRVGSARENNINTRPKSTAASKYKGVQQNKRTGKWYVQAGPRDGRVFLGGFDSEIEAARAYNELVRRLYGSIAYQNPV